MQGVEEKQTASVDPLDIPIWLKYEYFIGARLALSLIAVKNEFSFTDIMPRLNR